MAWNPISPPMQEFMDKDEGHFKKFLLNCMQEWHNQQPERRQKTHHSSSIRGCHRADYYFMGRGNVPVKIVRGFEFIPTWTSSRGKAYHEFTSTYFDAAGKLIEVFDWEVDDDGKLVNPGKLRPGSEVVLNAANVRPEDLALMEELNVSGVLDDIILIDTGDGEEPQILEKKTKESKTFLYKGLWQYFAADLEKWYDQVQMYMHFFRLPDGTQIKKAILWIMDAGDYNRLPAQYVTYDPAHIELIIMELRRSHAEAKAAPDGMPHRNPGKDFTNCKFCGARPICKPEFFVEW